MARPAGQGEKTKKHIAETAKVLFFKKGYTATSMEEIREASQISKGSIYCHFKSKEDLFLYEIEEASKVWRKNWEEQAEQVATAKEKLYLLAYHYATDMQELLSRTVPEYIASGDMKQMIEEKIIQLFQPEYDVFYQIIEEGLYNLEATLIIPIGVLAGLKIWSATILSLIGNLITFLAAVILAEQLKGWWGERRKSRKKRKINPKKRQSFGPNMDFPASPPFINSPSGAVMPLLL